MPLARESVDKYSRFGATIKTPGAQDAWCAAPISLKSAAGRGGERLRTASPVVPDGTNRGRTGVTGAFTSLPPSVSETSCGKRARGLE